MITIKKNIELELNGKEMVEEFWEQDCIQQAEFFNKNKFKDDDWYRGRG